MTTPSLLRRRLAVLILFGGLLQSAGVSGAQETNRPKSKQSLNTTDDELNRLREENQSLKKRIVQLSDELSKLENDQRLGVARARFVEAFSRGPYDFEFNDDKPNREGEANFIGRRPDRKAGLRLIGDKTNLTSALLVFTDTKDLRKTLSNIQASIEFLEVLDPDWKEDERLEWIASACKATEDHDVAVTIVRGKIRISMVKDKESGKYVFVATRK